jgi:uncharacterized spore protein YtfJ
MDVESLLAKASENLSVRRAFGAAYEKEGMLIIPVALVAGGGGGGTGPARASGDAPAPDAAPPSSAGHDEQSRDSGRADAGGGFGGVVLPSGVFVVKDGQARWIPAIDTTIAVVASLGLVGVLARTWAHRRRRRSR